jgi:NADH:ubiquinone reductase (non-electrogenic)
MFHWNRLNQNAISKLHIKGKRSIPSLLMSLSVPYFYFLAMSLVFALNSQRNSHIHSKPRLLCTSNERMGRSVSESKQRICIIGGGFGGLYSALKLDELFTSSRFLSLSGRHTSSATLSDDVEIWLFDKKDKFVFLPLLYELVIGDATVAEVTPRYETLLANTRVKFVQGEVVEFNPTTRKIQYKSESSDTLQECFFDQAIVASGTQVRLSLIPGSNEFAQPFYTVNHAHELQTKLKNIVRSFSDSNVTGPSHVSIIGAGYSGVELSINVAQFLRASNVPCNIKLIDRNDVIMKTSTEHNRVVASRCVSKPSRCHCI